MKKPVDLKKVIPTYYENNAINIKPSRLGYSMQFVADDGEENFEIYYHGEFLKKTLIVGEEKPSLIIAKSIGNQKEYLLFDGCLHGYDNMTWQEHSEDEKEGRTLKKLEIAPVKIFIDIEKLPDEKSECDVDENDCVDTDFGTKIPWETFERDAITWLEIKITDAKGKKHLIISEELA